MRAAVWFSHKGLPDANFDLPYQSRSPVLGKVINYETDEDILEEIERILNEKATKKLGIGQSLFYQMAFFCNPTAVISDWCWEMINDYYLATKYNISLGKDLDSIIAWRIDCFNIIESEINNIRTHERGLNGD